MERKESTSILEVLQIIDKSSKQLAIVVDDNKRLLGTISDGDIRRALLNNISLNESVKDIYFKTPTVANINNSKEEIINICRVKKIHQIPVVDDNGNLIGIEILDELISKEEKTHVGEFQFLLKRIDEQFSEELDKGSDEAEELI